MKALEEREKQLYTASKNTKPFVNQPPKELFKVVVNNYRSKKKIGETMMSDQQSLPPQPAGYIKFPEYDWF